MLQGSPFAVPSVALIGGTGIGERLLQGAAAPVHVPTPFGTLRAHRIRAGSAEALLVARHGAGHRYPPHRVPYQAIADGLRRLGVGYCLSTAAVGSLREDWGPGTFVVCSDFLDFTGRSLTMFEDSVAHTDFTHPLSPACREALASGATTAGVAAERHGVYVGANGPRYETPAEIRYYRSAGGDVVGMTASSEAIAMREAGIQYGCLAIVSNFAAGMGAGLLTHEEVVRETHAVGETAISILISAVETLGAA